MHLRSMLLAVAASAAFLGFGGLAMAAAPPGQADLVIIAVDDAPKLDLVADLVAMPGQAIDRVLLEPADDWATIAEVADIPDCAVHVRIDPMIGLGPHSSPPMSQLACRAPRDSPPE